MTFTPAMRGLTALGMAIPLALLGCDPTAKDADVDFGGDGVDTTGSDETEPESALYGPDNTWFHAESSALPDGLAGSGRGTGDIAENFTLLDQFGQEVELYQFYGQVIVLDAFAEW